MIFILFHFTLLVIFTITTNVVTSKFDVILFLFTYNVVLQQIKQNIITSNHDFADIVIFN